jgi:hypothetical protein
MSEIIKFLALILNELVSIDLGLGKQEEDIKAYLEQRVDNSLGLDELLIAGLKSTRTSFEILRDEIEELHELTVVLFKKEQS